MDFITTSFTALYSQHYYGLMFILIGACFILICGTIWFIVKYICDNFYYKDDPYVSPDESPEYKAAIEKHHKDMAFIQDRSDNPVFCCNCKHLFAADGKSVDVESLCAKSKVATVCLVTGETGYEYTECVAFRMNLSVFRQKCGSTGWFYEPKEEKK